MRSSGSDIVRNFERTRALIQAGARGIQRVLAMLLVLAFLLPSVGWAQGAMEPLVTVETEDEPGASKLMDPLEFDSPQGWDYLKPVGWMWFSNATFWAFSRFITNSHFAYISPSTIADNFRDGWEWDADGFPTNQFGHPYQGGLYHAGARASGFGFWAGLGYTALGSLHWEMLMETERPSYNDLITTTVGGRLWGRCFFGWQQRC